MTTSLAGPTRRAAPRIALVLALAGFLASALAGALPARAHGGRMRADVTAEKGSAPGERVITARLSFADGHPLTGLPVELTATAPGQAPVGPVPVPAAGEAGTYRTRVVFPAVGTWTVEVKAGVNRATATVGVAEEPSPVATPATTATASPRPAQGTATRRRGRTSPAVAVLGLLAGVAVAVVTLWFVKRRWGR